MSGGLLWDAGNVVHATRHGVSQEELDDMYALGAWIAVPDPQGRPDQQRLIGPTSRARLVTLAAEWIEAQQQYRPIASWPATRFETRWWLSG